ncbi:MAG: prepilin-type N-terminal cleavage/methylation domain-containing protein [Verrucomicrobiota bacterium]|nr:prepilin-type N-terminal cleavage/methylation domain-containing protein [Verrucomicrobiota bacterium]
MKTKLPIAHCQSPVKTRRRTMPFGSVGRPPAALENGFTLMETMVAAATGALLMAAVSGLSIFTARSYVAVDNYMDLSQRSRSTADNLGRIIRNSSALLAFSTNNPASLTLYDGTTGATNTITYDSTTGTLVLAQSGQSPQTNLVQCDQWSFQLYDRYPIISSTNITFCASTNSSGQLDPKYCKVINLSWKCSRKIIGLKLNTEDVQTAQIVLRNQVKN